ncbi:flavodoxin [Ruminococcus flavefaciens]|uniref:Flavodoxin n=1 Tax=Ruminococcus flavefaciens TaxID=1265 RepID=A0A1K1PH26_RUMFL|nr:flavodoxin [Ruminococcus flavefaciens]SFW47096.1 Flavodoxin [Ruminococcus flavefaciens]
MNKLISILASTVIAVSAMMTTSGTIKTSADADAVSASTEKTTYTIQDVRNLQGFILAKPVEEDLTGKPYDLNGDDRWDVYDLCLMRREVLKNPNTAYDNDTLVIYFSRTGNTEKIAEYLIDITNADSYVIEAAVPYSDADIKYQDDNCRANKEQNDKSVRPEIANPIASIDSYDTIFLGYPIWWGQEPRIIDTFLESYDFSDKTVIPFCTSASSGIATSEKNIKALVPIGNQLEGRRFSSGATKEDVKAWYDTLPLNEEKSDNKLKISVNGTELTATLEDNSSAQALTELLKQGNITVDMSDYGNFEKVGNLPQSLPKNDEKITTVPGDIILYQGNKITIYYAENTWDFTKLGHINNITQKELKAILGDGDITVTLSN